MEESGSKGTVLCGSWIRRPPGVNLVILGKSGNQKKERDSTKPSLLEIFSYDSKEISLSSAPLVTFEFELAEGNPIDFAVHPNGDEFACSTTSGAIKFFELHCEGSEWTVSIKDTPISPNFGVQQCLAFSFDGSRLATGGADGHLRILEWPSLRSIIDEPKAHKSIVDLDFSLDTKFLASTSTDGAGRVWNLEDAVPQTTLSRKPNEKIELCRFSKDGMKPILICAVQRADKSITVVYDINTWERLGFKRLIMKPPCKMCTSGDGKYLALGSKDGDISVTHIAKMEVKQYTKRLHPGSYIDTLQFCPDQSCGRVVLTTSKEWGANVSLLTVPADWKAWQLYMVLLGLFLASAVVFYFIFEHSDSFWNFPLGKDQPGSTRLHTIFKDRHPKDNSEL